MATIEIMTTGRIELSASGRTVAANVARLRADRGWSLRKLSEALAEAGRGLSQDAINKIENGAKLDDPKYAGKPPQIRRVDVDDLMALSVALGVSPATLLLPHDARGVAGVTGVGEVDARLAWQWMFCHEPLTLPADEAEADRAVTRFMLDSRPIGLFASEGDDRIPSMIRERQGGDG
ncbi:helix-turn-helix domain-containing protein [Streptomyces sp. NPDC088745]|uniref:helix-turn-helix domain-containing protein n=1 Tax=Streptomyces sp. NPDC088745 TaxID=3365884 RepID=UPI0038083861